MVIGRRIRRIFRDQNGTEIDTPVVGQDPEIQPILADLARMGRRVDLGEARPDLTVLTFLGEVRALYGETFVGVSNGSSLGGVLRLVHAPDDMWFEAMKILAAHAKAILVIADPEAWFSRPMSVQIYLDKTLRVWPGQRSSARHVQLRLRVWFLCIHQ